MLRKGFTLIELLIVITIIAILAGAAIPYVQDYIEDARLAKVRADLGEIRNAIIRYETETGKVFIPSNFGAPAYDETTFQSALVGPYLQQALTDPWGSPYYFSGEASIVYSAGADKDRTTNIIALDFRPATAPTRAFWIDVNKNGVADTGDNIDIKFTRPLDPLTALETNLVLPAGFAWGTVVGPFNPHPITGADNYMRITLAADSVLQPGIEIVGQAALTDTSANAAVVGTVAGGDLAAIPCRDLPVIIKPAQ